MEHRPLLEAILAAIETDNMVLPTLPDVAYKIQDLIDDPNVSADQLVFVISSDPFISAQIIKTANSAAFTGKPQLDNVRDAVSRLGYRQLRNLVMTDHHHEQNVLLAQSPDQYAHESFHCSSFGTNKVCVRG